MPSPQVLFSLICLMQCASLVAANNTTITDEPDVDESTSSMSSTTLEIDPPPPEFTTPTKLENVTLPPDAKVYNNSLFSCVMPDFEFQPPTLIDFVRYTDIDRQTDSIESHASRAFTQHVMATKPIVVIMPVALFNHTDLFEKLQVFMTTMRCYFKHVPFTFVKVADIDDACHFFDAYSQRESKAIYPAVVIVPGDYYEPRPECKKFHRNATLVQVIIDDNLEKVLDSASIILQARTIKFFVHHKDLTMRTAFDLLAVAMNPFLDIEEYEFSVLQLPPKERGTYVKKEETWQTSIIIATMVGFAAFIFVVSAIVLFGIHVENRKAKREFNRRKALVEHEEHSADVSKE